MARPQDNVSFFWEKRGFAHVFGHIVPFFSFASFLKMSHKRSPGGNRWRTAGAPLSNLQVPGRDNIGDVGL